MASQITAINIHQMGDIAAPSLRASKKRKYLLCIPEGTLTHTLVRATPAA
jgi:hypothetical protein